ncbi:transient receptor potential cation channel subfamily V member 1-like [Solea solea]|uniref:transient receptor potential cation channel subfamily V member 1-like n=1 Tax=Solea solea TaxID=90069 RepID=UPI00272C3A39|nr:transient receptor potential cation channel subfamily V member 1-like [Solea solea]XP_058490561.1 transient receptor potential cation channel subfamily V member 1-like [Solea solea]
MEKEPPQDDEQLNDIPENLDWLLSTDAEIIPMDTNIQMNSDTTDSVGTSAFTRERLFKAASQGDTTKLDGLLNYLLVNNEKRLTSPEFTVMCPQTCLCIVMMLQIEPLKSILTDKWDRFASKLFWMNFVVYLVYLVIFTTVACYRKEGEPPFPIENVKVDPLRLIGEFITVLGAVWFLYKSITIFIWNPPSFTSLYTDGVFDILFFLQATLLLICTILYVTGRREYVGLLVLSLALAWINVLYYSRGSKHMGIYAVMMQRMILSDLLTFLCVYSVLLVGFSAALVSLMDDSAAAQDQTPNNDSLPQGRSFDVEPFVCEKPTYDDLRFTVLELFKFTIGMGNLEFTDHVQYKEVFYILLITYIVLTYILLLNMLIALMGNTVERLSKENINIWNLQRASTILDIERGLSRFVESWLFSSERFKTLCLKDEKGKSRTFFRVQETNWQKWRSGLTVIQAEDPVNLRMRLPPRSRSSARLWERNAILERIRARYQQRHSSIFP